MVVTKRWRGMRWTQAVSKTSGTDADGKAVWSWRPTLASSPVEFIHKATVANKPDHRGERGISRKPLCNPQATVANKPDHRGERGISRKPQGMPGCLR